MNNISIIILSFTLPCLLTTLGSALIFLFSKPSKLINTLTLGFASGIMLSASIWSLLIPALDETKTTNPTLHPLIPVASSFVLGCLFMFLLDFICKSISKKQYKDKIFDKYNNKQSILCKNNTNNPRPSKEKAFKLFAAITIHNIPEGLSVGFAIGTAIATNSPLFSAFLFALGISIQNFPEGLATAIPIKNCYKSRIKGFFGGFLSGIVEPIFAIIGFYLATQLTFLLPWLLSFSAGAMIYVIIEELLPEITTENYNSFGIWSFIFGFLLMMALDICL
ncbi:MAG: ZIP family metal transporter [Clostridia bacterium]|nr:ZIP family metal transporter [Clostridia bacterium]